MAENVVSTTADIVYQLVTEFRFKTILGIVGFLFIFFCVFLIADRYTGYFSLSRIDRSIDLLDKLNRLDVSKDSELEAIKEKLILELDEAVAPKPFAQTFSFSNLEKLFQEEGRPAFRFSAWSRILTTMAPWLVLSLGGLKPLWNGDPKSIKNLFVLLGVGLFFGVFGLILPEIWWLDYLAYPIGHFGLIVFFILVAMNRSKRGVPAAEISTAGPTR